jgi:hypothetical protein
MELMDAVDESIPEPVRDVEKPFLMPVEDVFTISGRGTVVTGRIERGIVKVNEEVEIVGIREKSFKTITTSIEMFKKFLDEGRAGDNAALLLRGTKREQVERGMVVTKPGTTTPHTEFEGQVYILSKEEGGRHTPFFQNYRPQFYFRTTDVTGVVTLPEGTEMVMPGDNTTADVKLIQPIAMEGPAVSPSRGVAPVGCGPGHQDQQVLSPQSRLPHRVASLTGVPSALGMRRLHAEPWRGPRAQRPRGLRGIRGPVWSSERDTPDLEDQSRQVRPTASGSPCARAPDITQAAGRRGRRRPWRDRKIRIQAEGL